MISQVLLMFAAAIPSRKAGHSSLRWRSQQSGHWRRARGANAAFVLVCVEKIAGKPIVVLSAGTDGIDGNSPAAGAVADGETLARARVAGMDPGDFLRRSDSYTFFKRLGDAIETGPTGNNLRDLRVLLSL